MRQAARDRGAVIERERLEGIASHELKEERHDAWEEKLERFAAILKVDLKKLSAKKSDPTKVLLAAGMKQSTSVTNAWLAQKLNMGRAASVSQFSRRLLLQEYGKKAVRRLLSKVKH